MVGAAYIGSLPAFGFNSILVLKRKVERGKRKEEMIWFWEHHSNLFSLSSFSLSSFPISSFLHSLLSAITGSRRAAKREGMMPAISVSTMLTATSAAQLPSGR